MAELNRGGRRVLLRFAPEMNGNWNFWGQRPSKFIELWKRVFISLAKDAPLTSLVWAPSSGKGYPYGGGSYRQEDLFLLDTNKNGRVDSEDDPYLPYYPGDEFVDWIGMSIYFYGPQFPWHDNAIPDTGFFESCMNQNDFYNMFAITRDKPMMVAETGAAFHTNTPNGPGPGALATKQAFWRQYLTDPQFLEKYSKIKLISLFEFQKEEESNYMN
jgi:beta-mannanase